MIGPKQNLKLKSYFTHTTRTPKKGDIAFHRFPLEADFHDKFTIHLDLSKTKLTSLIIIKNLL